MSPLPAISVIIPLYNKAAYVRRCVASIQVQTMRDFEVVVIDDGSTDTSYEDFRRATADDPRFRIIRQANGGVSRARNAAIAECRADWVAFLDADDEWTPGFLRSILGAIEQSPAAVVVGSAFKVIQDEQREFIRRARFASNTSVGIAEFFHSWAQLGNCPLFIGASAAKRSELQAIGGFVPGMNLGEELLVFIRLLDRGKLAYVTKPLATYHLSAGGSLSTSPSVAALRSHTPLLHELARQVKLGHCPRPVYRKWLDMQADYLIHKGMRTDLLKLMWSEPANWSGKFWVRAALEMIGVRSLMSRAFSRPNPG